MNSIMWFLKLRFLILKNTLFKDSKTISKNLVILMVIVVLQYI